MDKSLYLLLAFLVYASWRAAVWNWALLVHFTQLLTSPKYTSKSTTIETTTFSYYPTDTVLQPELPCFPHCQSLTNVSLPLEMGYDDPELVLSGTQSLACLPRLFGYQQAKGLEVFPWVGYPSCRSLVTDPYPFLSLDYSSNHLRMNCTGSGTYVLGPIDRRKLVLRHEVESLWQIKAYPGSPVPIDPMHEFAFGACDSDSQYMQQAVYIPRYNASLHEAARTRMRELQSSGPPFSVLILVVDSFSRKHFFRKLPKTVEFLNKLKQGDEYHIADFYIHNIVGTNSVGNQAPLLGRNIQEEYIGDLNKDFAGKWALWNLYKDKGFLTLFGLESCDNSFPRKLGRMPNIDYVSSPFFCAAYRLTNYKASKTNNMQRCIGPAMSHVYLFNYTLAFADLYPDVHKWVYVHVDAAHESTGQHAETLDSDLVEFMRSYMRKNPNTVVFLEGDHGMRYGDWMKSVEAFQENRLPPLFLITPKALTKEIPGAEQTLAHNSLRLNSKYDMRKTLIYLSGVPYDRKDPGEELFPAVNMYTQRVEDNRTCQEAGIPAWHCSCLVLIPISEAILRGEDRNQAELTELLRFLAEDAISYFNSLVYIPVGMHKGGLCRKLTARGTDRAYGLQLDPMMEEIKLEFGVNELETARFEVLYLVSSAADFTTITEEGFPISSLIYNGYRKQIRMLSFSRLDKYSGPCEQLARSFDLEAEVCICSGIF